MDSRTLAGTMARRKLARWTTAPGVLLVVACAAGGPRADSAAGSATVETLIGDAACTSDSQCHTIGVGAKACGGPERFVAWSNLRTDAAELELAAARATSIERAKVQVPGKMSNCALVTDPGAYCGEADATPSQGVVAQGQPVAARRCRLRAPSSVSVARGE